MTRHEMHSMNTHCAERRSIKTDKTERCTRYWSRRNHKVTDIFCNWFEDGTIGLMQLLQHFMPSLLSKCFYPNVTNFTTFALEKKTDFSPIEPWMSKSYNCSPAFCSLVTSIQKSSHCSCTHWLLELLSGTTRGLRTPFYKMSYMPQNPQLLLFKYVFMQRLFTWQLSFILVCCFQTTAMRPNRANFVEAQ